MHFIRAVLSACRSRPKSRLRFTIAAIVLGSQQLSAQQQVSPAQTDSALAVPRLDTVRVTAPVAPRTVTFLPDRFGTVLLTGKRTEVLLVDSVGANTAQNVARQVLGRVPGMTVAETEGSGFPSNGIAVRGLNPTQSIEMNVRQNGRASCRERVCLGV